MNIRIPLPRVPARLTAILDAYSDWAEVKTGPTLRFLKWSHTVERMDWVTLGVAVAGCCVLAALYGPAYGFIAGPLCFLFGLILFEMSTARSS